MKKAPHQLTPPDYLPVHIEAFQAMNRGDATPHQQKLALRWLIEEAAGTYNLSFAPENERLTSFAEGRRFVGLQVVKMLKLNASKLKEATHG